ncbi:hypothetical protein L083_5199 [Actinoplanes sp. N902-109]|nr:hypothetical protein L083_5199 [Actinoplanes sp. N902-109]
MFSVSALFHRGLPQHTRHRIVPPGWPLAGFAQSTAYSC